MSGAGMAVVASSAAAVATGGNGRGRRNTGCVTAVADVATASGDGGERAHAAEPFAWLWARRRAAEDAAKLEAATTTLSEPAAADRHGAGQRAMGDNSGAGATTASAFDPEAAPRPETPAHGTPNPVGRALVEPHRPSVLQGAGEGVRFWDEAEATAAAPAPSLPADAAFLYRFAREAFAVLVEREPDPIEAQERAAVAAGLEGPAGT